MFDLPDLDTFGRFLEAGDTYISNQKECLLTCVRWPAGPGRMISDRSYRALTFQLDRTGGKISGPQSLHPIYSYPNTFAVLRTSKLVEVVGPGPDDSLVVDEKPGKLGLVVNSTKKYLLFG